MSKSQKDSINDYKSDQDSLSNKQFLNKKKKRDSNISSEMEQNSLTNHEIRCSICLGEEKLIPNCFKCKTCEAYFHVECYNLFTFPETIEAKLHEENVLENFECYRCKKEKEMDTEFRCSVCKRHEDIMKQFEPKQFVHHYCYVFFKDSLGNIKSGGSCKECSHKKIPVLKCEEGKCKDKYHIQCAINKGIIIWLPFMRGDEKINPDKFNDKITFLCYEHNEIVLNEFKNYALTMQISKNDKENTENKEQKNENKNAQNIECNKKEKKHDNININKGEQKSKELNEEKAIINSVINLNIANESNNNINNINNPKEEKEKNNSNSNSNNNIESIGSSPKTPVKIDLGNKHSSKNIGSSKLLLSNSPSDIINVSIKKEKSSAFEDEIDINILKEDSKVNNNNNNEEVDEDDEDVEYNPPKIKHEDIDLFGNFFEMNNEKFILPASFCKFHYY